MKLLFLIFIGIPFLSIAQEEGGEEQIYQIVEKSPEFPGGEQKLMEFIADSLRYPEEAIAGVVYISFVVEKDGTITHIELLKGVMPVMDEEAMRVMSIMPKWIPGEQAGKPIRVRMRIPIRFRLT